MSARLLFLDGDPNRPPFALGDETVTLGRHPQCELVLASSAVSRRHARIRPDAQRGYVLEDLGSRNGTILNGFRIAEPTALRTGDVVRMCDVELRFEQEVVPAAAPGGVQVFDADRTPEIVSTLIADTASVQGCNVDPLRALGAVLKVTGELAGGVDLDYLLPRVLEHVFELFPQADQGAILLTDPDGELVPRAVRSRDGQDVPLQISRTVVERALQQREAVLSRDAPRDAQFAPSQSLLQLPIRSVMCVPVLGGAEEPLGVLQLHSASADQPFTSGCLDIMMTVANAAGVAVANARLHERLLQRDRLERDVVHAREVQRSFLPRHVPPVAGYECFAYYEAARDVGGDYYGFHDLAEGRWAIGLGDVSGKGLAAALWMARLSSDVRYALSRTRDPASALALVNRELLASAPENRFVTFALIVLDPARHRMAFANAGHPPPLLRRADGVVEPLAPPRVGAPLNVTDAAEHAPQTGCRDLLPGELVLLYSDGVTEARSRGSDEEFGQDRLRAALAAAPAGAEAAGEAVVAALRNHVGGGQQGDDTTLVCVGRAGGS